MVYRKKIKPNPEQVFYDRTGLFRRISDNNQHIQSISKMYLILFNRYLTSS